MSGILQESWLGEVVAGWDRVRKLNAFEERDLACLSIIVTIWNFGARNEILSFEYLLFFWDNASYQNWNTFAFCEVRTSNSYSEQPTNFKRTVFEFYHINLSGFWICFSVFFLIFYALLIPIWSFWDLFHLNSLFFFSNLNAETKKNLKNMSPNFLLKLRVQSISENYFVRISFGTG